MNTLPKHVHIVGICGVATSALAIALHDKGVKVTGSDKGFYPPVSTHLDEAGISYHAGWHPENIGKPDEIVIGGGGTSPSNPEIIYANENKIPLLSFAEALGKYVIKEESIVVTGTWGKTTTSSLLSFVLIHAGFDPSYFTGGLSMSHKTGAISDSKWSVVEGDEYQVSISDRRPKFVFYKPTHLLLTSVSWDHADLYPTEKDYFDTFEKLISEVSNKNGVIVACADNAGVQKVLPIIKSTSSPSASDALSKNVGKTVTYGKSEIADYKYHSIQHTKNGLSFIICHKGIDYIVASPMLGKFNAENITATFAMAHTIGITPEKIIEAIKNFKGIKRRLEKRYEGDVTVLDCHAPTPEKAISVLESIRDVYKEKIYAVYEPNIGGRQKASAHMYDGAFRDADVVVIPRLTKLKVASNASEIPESEIPLESDELMQIISKTHKNVVQFDEDTTLVQFLKQNAKKDDVIAFLGSHGFRGMIEETIKNF